MILVVYGKLLGLLLHLLSTMIQILHKHIRYIRIIYIFFQKGNVDEHASVGKNENIISNFIEDVEKPPLYPGCINYIKMSPSIALFKHKSSYTTTTKKVFMSLYKVCF